jgi:hypothetical protein
VIERNIQNETIEIAVLEQKTRYDIAKDILGAFGIKVKAVDKNDTSPVIRSNLEKLTKLNLPTFTYKEIIDATIDEIQHRELFEKL